MIRTRVRLKKIAHYRGISEETNAFNAEVWIGREKMGYASNRGHGDPVHVDYVSKECREAVDAEIKRQEPQHTGLKNGDGSEFIITPGEDYFFATLIEDDLRQRDLKRLRNKFIKQSKVGTLYQEKGQKRGQYFTHNGVTPDQVRKHLGDKVVAMCDPDNPDEFIKVIDPDLFKSEVEYQD